MIDERKHIDNYFADSLEDHAEENLDLDLNWKGIESKLNKYAFFRFSMHRFNIYYLGIIFLNIAIWFFVRSDSDYKTVDSAFQENQKTSKSLNALTPGIRNKSTSVSRQTKRNVNVTSGEDLTASSSPLMDPVTKPIDTLKGMTDEAPKATVLSQHETEKRNDSLGIKKVKPPVVINRKRDTIIKVDTVYINKKKRNK